MQTLMQMKQRGSTPARWVPQEPQAVSTHTKRKLLRPGLDPYALAQSFLSRGCFSVRSMERGWLAAGKAVLACADIPKPSCTCNNLQSAELWPGAGSAGEMLGKPDDLGAISVPHRRVEGVSSSCLQPYTRTCMAATPHSH